MKIAIVGCGKIADGHVEQIQKMPHLGRLVAVCDREPLMAEQLASRYHIPKHYDDFERLLTAERPDVVHIATPPASHLALARMALDSGCHIYVEKPLTLSYPDSRKLVAMAEEAGKKLTVGYTYLFDPPAFVMRQLIEEGVVGDLIHIESFYGYNLAGPFGSAIMADGAHWVHSLPGGLWQNNIDHLLNKIVELIDDDAPKVTAHGYRLRSQRYGDKRDEMLDEVRLMISGQRLSAYGTFSSHIRPASHLMRLYGSNNTVHLDFLSRTVTLEATTSLPSAVGRLVPAFNQALGFAKEGVRNVMRFARSDYHFFAGLEHLIRRYYESIHNGTPPPIPYRDILRIAAMIESIDEQLRGQVQSEASQ